MSTRLPPLVLPFVVSGFLGCTDSTDPGVAPAPSINSLAPETLAIGHPDPVVTVQGTGFVATTVLSIDGQARPTTVESDTRLRAMLRTSDVTNPDTVTITVHTPPPGGGTSDPVAIVVSWAVPAIDSIRPAFAMTRSSFFEGVVYGSGFSPQAQISGQRLSQRPVEVSWDRAVFQMGGENLLRVARIDVRVTNPPPAGASAPHSFEIRNPRPEVTDFSPSEVPPGVDASLTIRGQGFRPTTVARWNGDQVPTFWDSDTRLEIDVRAELVQSGLSTLQLSSPGPGGGTSTVSDVPVRAPRPGITLIRPWALEVGEPTTTTLQVYGGGWSEGSIGLWNGSPRPTRSVTPSQLAVTVSPEDQASASTGDLQIEDASTGVRSRPWRVPVVHTIPVPPSRMTVALPNHDLAYDSVSGLLLLSVGPSAGE